MSPCLQAKVAANDLHCLSPLALHQELFASGLRSGYVRTTALQCGTAPAPLVQALLSTMTQVGAGGMSGWAFAVGCGRDGRRCICRHMMLLADDLAICSAPLPNPPAEP